jgi:undecaprenyl diphosphate synthase
MPTTDSQTPDDLAAQRDLIASGAIPASVAVIMDGNGRWAQARGQHRYVGHHEGVVSVRDVTESAVQIGIQHLTLYTFSTENWNRPAEEVAALMELLVETVAAQRQTLLDNGVRLQVLGDLDALPAACVEALQALMDETAQLTNMTLHLALSYSGRWEIVRAARRLAEQAAAGTLDPSAIDEQMVASHLDTAGLPDPDLLIRTGGEMRVSNFLLWSIAYTEFYVTDTLWPDFRRPQLYAAVRDFQLRERRFGGVIDAPSTPAAH